jgi:lipopolysaccharide export system permease protein
MKEVVIDDPDYTAISGELEELTIACNEYTSQHLQQRYPNYLGMFVAGSNRDMQLLRLDAKLNACVGQLGNSRSHELLKVLNNYPVLSMNAHVAPMPRKWMNIAVGIALPVGVALYLRALFFRQRLREDLNAIIKTNKEIQNIIYERKL